MKDILLGAIFGIALLALVVAMLYFVTEGLNRSYGTTLIVLVVLFAAILGGVGGYARR